ncbi:MAG TPA: hypothetical protein PLU10_07945 [Chitinophagaceae bacterium]|nr:hypothetical protein [Chitinophagaceae bacterium]
MLSCQSGNQHPTYSKDIAPIVYRSCSPCHRPNQIGHFNLLTYEDVRTNAVKMLYTIQHRLMPPWPADAHYTEFVGQTILSDDEINLIETWVNLKCPIGDSLQIPPIPKFPEGSLLRNPDMHIPVKPIQMKSDFADRFLIVKVPFEVPQDSFIQTVEFVPGNTKVVHHVNGDMVRFDYDKKTNVYDGLLVDDVVLDSTVREVYKRIGLLHDDGSYPTLARSVVNYLPGVKAQEYPEGIGGWKVNRKNAFLFSDIHYGPTVDNIWDSSYVNIFLSKKKPTRPLQEFQLGTLGVAPIAPPLRIPPNQITSYSSRYVVPFDISILTVNPHMHLLGKSFLAYALTPQHDTIRLIRIPRWDFNWQNFYTFKKMIKIPKGSTIVMEGVFDNTEDNPLNPNHPPKMVQDRNGSMSTTDEMFQFIITYLPYQEGDENILLGD